MDKGSSRGDEQTVTVFPVFAPLTGDGSRFLLTRSFPQETGSISSEALSCPVASFSSRASGTDNTPLPEDTRLHPGAKQPAERLTVIRKTPWDPVAEGADPVHSAL